MMAKVISLMMTIFIVVPILAPSLGQGILFVSHWRGIFGSYILLALVCGAWFAIRQPESLPPKLRIPFAFKPIGLGFVKVFSNWTVMGYTLIAGIISGVFLTYISTSQQVLQFQYALGTKFPLYFASIALATGVSSFINAKLVVRYGMQRIALFALVTLLCASLLFLLVTYHNQGHPALWSLIGYLMSCFFCLGLLFGNLNALAMQPLGDTAGTGAAIIGFTSTLISLPIALLIGRAYDGSFTPIVVGFTLCAAVSLVMHLLTTRARSAAD